MKKDLILIGQMLLDAREIETLRLAASGLTNEDISDRLGLSPKTVEKMLGNTDPFRAIYPKIGVSNRAQAAAWYVDRFGIPSSEPYSKAQPHDHRSQTEQLMDLGVTAPYFLEVVTDYSLRLRDLWEGGNPELAMSTATSLSNGLRRFVTNSSFSEPMKPFFRVLARVLYEQGLVCKVIGSPDNALITTVPFAKEISDIAKLCNDPEIAGLAYLHWADAFYIREQFYESAQWFTRASNLVTEVDEKLGMLRGLALSYAYLNESSQFARVKSEVVRLIEAGSFTKLDVVCSTLEGLARSEGLLRLPAALDTLYEARGYHANVERENGRRPIRAIQLDRSEFEILTHTQVSDKVSLERLGTSTLMRAQEQGYHRHAIKIGRLLERQLG